MDNQIIQLSAIKLEALMELGDRTSAMETVSGGDRRSEEFQNSNGRIFDTTKTKAEQLSELALKFEPELREEAKARMLAGKKIDPPQNSAEGNRKSNETRDEIVDITP